MREKRGDVGAANGHHIECDVALLRNWSHFISCGDNKSGLAKCYVQYITRYIIPVLGMTKCVYLSGGKDYQIVKVTPDSVDVI